MSSEEKLMIAFHLVESGFGTQIVDMVLNTDSSRIKAVLKNGTTIYVQYNDYDEYAYMVQFSIAELDRCIFDNYDRTWLVDTAPNHFHPVFDEHGFSSPMTGDAEHDIPLLCESVKSGNLKDINWRPQS